ncbi:hypothetical protein UFOVP1382_51 [uncultured Caudovirales phage]|uniref:Uncharacterized protein n=1 Tax=uncultured Caudovirales phage TaxID=2100421 RepID=A0A6J5S589_9CAUD|nr:hypothetical protein UFOVP1382_51 [uncultured Caudovirales phage]
MSAAAVAKMPPAFKTFFEERAAIMEYDGGLRRDEAERLALAATRELYRQHGPLYGQEAA